MLLDVASSTAPHLVIGLGKDGSAYVVDRDKPGGVGGELVSRHVASDEIINAAAAYTTSKGAYVAFRGTGSACPGAAGDLVALRITPSSIETAWCARENGRGSPIVTTAGGASAVVWAAGAEGDQRLHGFDGDTGSVVFGGGAASEQMSGLRRFMTPIVAKGRIYLGADDRVYAFAP